MILFRLGQVGVVCPHRASHSASPCHRFHPLPPEGGDRGCEDVGTQLDHVRSCVQHGTSEDPVRKAVAQPAQMPGTSSLRACRALISRAMSSTPGSSTTMSISSRPPFLRRWYTRRRREVVAISGRSCVMTNVSIVRPASRCCPRRRRRRLRAPRPSWRHPRRSASATWSGGQAGCRPRQTWSPPRSCSVWTNLQHRFGSTLSIGLGQSRLWL